MINRENFLNDVEIQKNFSIQKNSNTSLIEKY